MKKIISIFCNSLFPFFVMFILSFSLFYFVLILFNKIFIEYNLFYEIYECFLFLYTNSPFAFIASCVVGFIVGLLTCTALFEDELTKNVDNLFDCEVKKNV